MKWLRGGRGDTGGEGDQLSPIRIYTPDLELSGRVAPTGQRITDMLLRGQDLAFLPDGADGAPENWLWIAPSDILLVIPPPLDTRRSWHEVRDLVELSVQVGDYRLRGTAHLARGEAPGPDLVARQTFLPLTEARVVRGEDGEVEDVDVAIVNLARSTVEPT